MKKLLVVVMVLAAIVMVGCSKTLTCQDSGTDIDYCYTQTGKSGDIDLYGCWSYSISDEEIEGDCPTENQLGTCTGEDAYFEFEVYYYSDGYYEYTAEEAQSDCESWLSGTWAAS